MDPVVARLLWKVLEPPGEHTPDDRADRLVRSSTITADQEDPVGTAN